MFNFFNKQKEAQLPYENTLIAGSGSTPGWVPVPMVTIYNRRYLSDEPKICLIGADAIISITQDINADRVWFNYVDGAGGSYKIAEIYSTDAEAKARIEELKKIYEIEVKEDVCRYESAE